MSVLFWKFFAKVGLWVLKLRYRIKVKGFEELKKGRFSQSGGILFLPNHPASIEPLMLFFLFWPKYQLRPLAIEYICRTGFMKLLIQATKAIPIPNFDVGVNQFKINKADRSLNELIDGLKKGDHFILYPSGKLKLGGKEVVGGASAAYMVFQKNPDVNVVLVRTSGLWGSTFSSAFTGTTPDLGKVTLNGLKTLLKNFIFFCKRRDVLIEIAPNPEGIPVRGSKIELNRFLEKWYNNYPDEKGGRVDVEPLKLVSYSFWKKDLPKVFEPKSKRSEEELQVSEEIKGKIYGEIKRIVENPALQIQLESSLALDIGMDSLNIAELITYLTTNFSIEKLYPEDLETVQDVLHVAVGTKIGRRAEEPAIRALNWKDIKDRPMPDLPLGRTIPEAFLNSCARMKNFEACGDDTSGILTYKKLKKVALVLSQYFRAFPEERIGVMLPSSVGAYVAILAIQLAKKTAVLLNWTLGPHFLEEMVKSSEVQKVVTSWKFLDQAAQMDLGAVEKDLLFLEDIKKSLSLKQKLKGLTLSFLPQRLVVKYLGLNQIYENSPALILFTSGTEALPKGVPLSHKNILFVIRSASQAMNFKDSDRYFSVLPPFHSFGLTVMGLNPILSGFIVAFFPDPTDGFSVAERIKEWKMTVFAGPPGFIRGLFHAAKNDDLKTLRLVVSGAEKAPKQLFDLVSSKGNHIHVMEGYGITECSPAITFTRPNLLPVGVGKAIPDVSLRTIHPETLEPLKTGENGEICVKGDNVFQGYLGHPKSPFIEIDQEKWYRTGDLGYLDQDQNLHISGRLKRFIKLGGEMIGLGAVEETILKGLIDLKMVKPDQLSIAIIADEKDPNKPQIILITTFDIDQEKVNEIIRSSGMGRLVKISSVKKVDQIPVLGSGKTNYRKLQQVLENP